MSIITIVPSDKRVYVDGVAKHVDCTGIADPATPGVGIHAVQWNGTTGWIEYINDPFNPVGSLPNRAIADISPFQIFIDAWTHATNPSS